MQQEASFPQAQGIAVLTETGYQVMEGRGALVNRNSIFFTIGQGISLIGDGFYLATLIIWISAITLASAQTPAEKVAAAATITAIQAGIFGAMYLANVLVVPFVGVFVDRWNRRTTMIISDLTQAAFALLPLGAFFVAKSVFVPTLYVSYFLLIAAQGFFTGSQSGVLQVIVARKNLPQVVSALNVLLGVGLVAGFAFAPLFFLAVGPVVAIVVNAVSFLISAATLLLLRIPVEAVHPYAFKASDASAEVTKLNKGIVGVLKDLLRGLRFVFATSVLLGIVIMLVVAYAGGAVANSVLSGFFFANLHADPVKDLTLIGLIPAAIYGGGIVGALLAGVLARFMPLRMLTVTGVFGVGALILATAYQTTVVNGIIFFTLVGVFNNLFFVSYSALVLKVTPNTFIGRVEGILAPLAALSGYITTLIVGSIVTAYNPALNPKTPFPHPAVLFLDLFLVSSALIVIGSIIGFTLTRRAKEEAINIEHFVVAPTMAVVGTPETPAL